ncbi:MAG TPA: CPBP family intramembrane glutamic endopeptidase [Aquihabitans sp.]|jgi:hypothetical protein|nr:CPBP family intramembrane glutamic endopeptidase [Aquihabitans sp.]
MTATPPATVDAPAGAPRWGLGDAAGGWLLAQFCAAVGTALLAGAFGYSQQQRVDGDVSLAFTALQFPPLWLGFVGVPIWAAATKGRGWIRDFRVRLQAVDVPLGVVAGVVGQYVVVVLVSLPILWLTDTTFEELGEPARELGERATTPGTVVLLFLMVVVGAPIAEEIFFRGLLLRSLEKRFGLGWAVAGSSVIFGATHFQPLQFVALTAAGAIFALLVVRTGRLGPAIVAHMAFNAATVVSLVWEWP